MCVFYHYLFHFISQGVLSGTISHSVESYDVKDDESKEKDDSIMMLMNDKVRVEHDDPVL